MRRSKLLKAGRFGDFLRSTLSWWRSATISASRSHGEVDSDRRSGRVRLRSPTLETTMQTVADRPEAPNTIRNDLGAIFISLELSRSTWLITSLSPDGGEKMSKHSVPAGDIYALLARISEFKQKAFAHHRHSGSGVGRLLDSPRAAAERDRKPRRRSGLDRDL